MAPGPQDTEPKLFNHMVSITGSQLWVGFLQFILVMIGLKQYNETPLNHGPHSSASERSARNTICCGKRISDFYIDFSTVIREFTVKGGREDRWVVGFSSINGTVWSRQGPAGRMHGEMSPMCWKQRTFKQGSTFTHSFSALLTSPPIFFQFSLRPPCSHKLAAQMSKKHILSTTSQAGRKRTSLLPVTEKKIFPRSTHQTFPYLTGQPGSSAHPQTCELDVFQFPPALHPFFNILSRPVRATYKDFRAPKFPAWFQPRRDPCRRSEEEKTVMGEGDESPDVFSGCDLRLAGDFSALKRVLPT